MSRQTPAATIHTIETTLLVYVDSYNGGRSFSSGQREATKYFKRYQRNNNITTRSLSHGLYETDDSTGRYIYKFTF